MREFYEQLVGTQSRSYWPSFSEMGDDVANRGMLAPRVVSGVADITPEYLWISTTCGLAPPMYGTEAAPLAAWQELQGQFLTHSAAVLKATTPLVGRDALMSIASAVLDLLPVPNALAALESWGTVMADLRRPMRQRLEERRRRSQALAQDALTVPGAEAREPQAVRFADVLAQTAAAAALPLAVIVDNAHWADVGTQSLVRRLLTGRSKGVIVLTSWPPPVQSAPDPRLEELIRDIQSHPGSKLHDVALHPIATGEMRKLVREQVQAIPRPEEDHIVARAGGNPLLLNAILSLSSVAGPLSRGDRVPPSVIEQLPRSVEQIYNQQWMELPQQVQTALAAVAWQGQQFTPTWLDRWDAKYSTSLQAADRRFGWIAATDNLGRFREPVLHSVAEDARHRDQDPRLLEAGIRAFVQFTDGILERGELHVWSPQARAVLLDSYARLWLSDEDLPLENGDVAGVLLADDLADQGDHARSRRLLERVAYSQLGAGLRLRYFAVYARTLRELGEPGSALGILDKALLEIPPRSLDYSAMMQCERLRAQFELGLPGVIEATRELVDDALGAETDILASVRGDVALLAAQVWTEAENAFGAIEWIEQVISLVKGRVAPTVELTLRHRLAVALANEMRFAEAKSQWDGLLHSLDDARITDAPAEISLVTSAASWFPVIGHHEAGLELMRESVSRSSAIFGAAHPRSIEARQNLGYWLVESGEPDEGMSLLRAAADDAELGLSSHSRRRMNVLKNLARAQRTVGSFDDAVATLEGLRDLLFDLDRGEDHILPGIRLELSAAHAGLGEMHKARVEAEAALDQRERQLGKGSWRAQKAALHVARLSEVPKALEVLSEYRDPDRTSSVGVTGLEIETELARLSTDAETLQRLLVHQEGLLGPKHRLVQLTRGYYEDALAHEGPTTSDEGVTDHGLASEAFDHFHIEVGVLVNSAVMGSVPEDSTTQIGDIEGAWREVNRLVDGLMSEQEGRGHVVSVRREPRRVHLEWEEDYRRGRVIEIVGCTMAH